jgi:mannose-6-phosphate isomerase-like protein (cupin superfamily)
MLTNKQYIESGILEQYVLGAASAEECRQVEVMAAADPAVQQELEAIALALQQYATTNAVTPNPVVKPFLLATIDYTERLKNGEPVLNPPLLSQSSTVADYAAWLDRSDMVAQDTDEVFAKIIGYTPQAITAIVWLKDYAPHEVHDDEYERFFIVEGTCDIIVEDEVHPLKPGDYFAIPLHKTHMVKVTSATPCKVILQRVAA